MKTKTISISFQIPADYKFMAQTPWGSFILFKRRPKMIPALCKESCEVEPDGTCPHGCPSLFLAMGINQIKPINRNKYGHH